MMVDECTSSCFFALFAGILWFIVDNVIIESYAPRPINRLD